MLGWIACKSRMPSLWRGSVEKLFVSRAWLCSCILFVFFRLFGFALRFQLLTLSFQDLELLLFISVRR